MSTKFKTQNGWTKERMKAQVRAKNNGTPATWYGACVYETKDGLNRCAVGCFIPDGHAALRLTGTVYAVLDLAPELIGDMPLRVEGMSHMQSIHDGVTTIEYEADVRDVLCDWIDANVEDAP